MSVEASTGEKRLAELKGWRVFMIPDTNPCEGEILLRIDGLLPLWCFAITPGHCICSLDRMALFRLLAACNTENDGKEILYALQKLDVALKDLSNSFTSTSRLRFIVEFGPFLDLPLMMWSKLHASFLL